MWWAAVAWFSFFTSLLLYFCILAAEIFSTRTPRPGSVSTTQAQPLTLVCPHFPDRSTENKPQLRAITLDKARFQQSLQAVVVIADRRVAVHLFLNQKR